MTRALLTKKFVDALGIGGYIVVVDSDGTGATVFQDKRDLNGRFVETAYIGKLTYRDQSVDYDELMRLVRSIA